MKKKSRTKISSWARRNREGNEDIPESKPGPLHTWRALIKPQANSLYALEASIVNSSFSRCGN